jgi:hypothetical protein
MYDCLYSERYTGNVLPEPRNPQSPVTFLPLHDYCTQFRLTALKVLPDIRQLSPAGLPTWDLRGVSLCRRQGLGKPRFRRDIGRTAPDSPISFK